jgi:hypothetical protein
MAEAPKPIAFCEHLQLSSLGVQPGSISFQVRRVCWQRILRIPGLTFIPDLLLSLSRYVTHADIYSEFVLDLELKI